MRGKLVKLIEYLVLPAAKQLSDAENIKGLVERWT